MPLTFPADLAGFFDLDVDHDLVGGAGVLGATAVLHTDLQDIVVFLTEVQGLRVVQHTWNTTPEI